jgi:hypothetical protein
LRTNPSLHDQLYAKLALALSDPEIRDAFIPYVRRAPSWLPGLIVVAAGTANPDSMSYAIRQAGGLPKGEIYQSRAADLLGALFAKKKFAEGRAFFNALPGSDAKVVTSAAFTDAAFDPKFLPISWSVETTSNAGAAVEANGKARIVRAFALSGAGGIAASKYLFIPPGVYRFDSVETINTPSANSRATWQLRCASAADQAVIYQYDIIRSAQAGPPSTQVTIPASCPVQRLELLLSGGDNGAGLDISVTQVEIGR